jgi:hypothetical protein
MNRNARNLMSAGCETLPPTRPAFPSSLLQDPASGIYVMPPDEPIRDRPRLTSYRFEKGL